MSYPLGVVTRTITVGDSITVESGTDVTVRATLGSSRGLVWVATGERAVSVPEVRKSATAGDAVTFTPPVTDQSGWRDLATGALIDVSVPGSHTHTYNIELVALRAGLPVDMIASVASFFVSRVDTKVDGHLAAMIDRGGMRAEKAELLPGKAAIANARLAYENFKKVFGSERFQALKAHYQEVFAPAKPAPKGKAK